MKRVAIVGAGPAGMMAAYFAQREGSEVILIEKNERPGRKLIITGKGRCNITNSCDAEDFIKNTITNPYFMYSSIYFFPNTELIKLLESQGLSVKVERGGRVFPASDRAVDVVDAMARLIGKGNIRKYFSKSCKDILIKDNRICGVVLNNGEKINCDALILATGGIYYPKTGSTGDGQRIAGAHGHRIVDMKPSLTALKSEDMSYVCPKGLKLRNVGIELFRNKKKVYEDFGEMEFYEDGADGPIIKSASCHMKDDGEYVFKIDLKPALTKEKLDNRIQREIKENPKGNLRDILKTLLPMDLISTVSKKGDLDLRVSSSEITREQRAATVDILKGLNFKIDSKGNVNHAIVTSGGIDVREIDPSTMESKLIEGLYFAGEMIDVDAYTGGFNLQIAFSTGALAGYSAAHK